MKVHWLLPFNIGDVNQLKEVNLASIRLRLGTIIQNINSNVEISVGENIAISPDILIIGKLKFVKKILYCFKNTAFNYFNSIYIII